MFLSSLMIQMGDNPDRPRPGRLWLANHYRVHQRLCMAFPSSCRQADDPYFLKPYEPADFGEGHVHVARSENAGFLYRVDYPPANRAMILVQSSVKPNWEYAFHNAEYLLDGPPRIRTYTPMFENGQRCQFRLIANPTRKIETKTGSDGKRKHGKRVPVRPDRFLDWLIERSEVNGFEIESKTISIESSYVFVRKSDHGNGERLCSVRYDGFLRVTNSDSFLQAITKGIGPAKAYGFGLLSAIPAMDGG
jgi:CRISPR system Cascade subunit CasE